MKDMPTKERILYAALDLISEKGYDGVGVDLIAENAGLKGPSLYRHYKGKEDIFFSLIDMIESHYSKGFGLINSEEGFPESMDELIENEITFKKETFKELYKVGNIRKDQLNDWLKKNKISQEDYDFIIG